MMQSDVLLKESARCSAVAARMGENVELETIELILLL